VYYFVEGEDSSCSHVCGVVSCKFGMETTSNNYSKNFKLPLDNYKMDMFENQTSVFSKPPHRKVSSPHDELGEQDATPLLARVAFDSYRRNILEKFSLGKYTCVCVCVCVAGVTNLRKNRIGCYALYNGDQALCYVGYTKNLQRKIAFHAKLQPDNCKFFKAFVVENPKVSAAYLEKILDAWLLEYGSVPPGNSTQRHLWEGRKVTCVCVFCFVAVRT